MKTISKITIGLVAATLLFVGCNESATPADKNGVSKTVTEESLGLRKTDLYSEKSDTFGDEAKYSTAAAGTSQRIKRAFQDAPPMIPHDTEGMVPITISDNQCTGCHMPEVAASMGATPIPSSHFTNFRPASFAVKDENTGGLENISIKKEQKLVGARFNCNQCHASQSGDALAVENTFEADFTHADGASKSSWSGTKLMEGIDTTK
ncbi:MAG: nitrate reductase cytochrome c-type subunit [Campylobacterota bacterium]|nr:nitrate reductase cytochrome c-type subunit [Campylobacterota bacterium]